jgi:hypothetical protein
MTLAASNALVGLAVLVALLLLIYGPWQWACTDYARQILFEKRDEIFDMAADGELSFNSSQYHAIRGSLESCIRFAHDLTLPNFVYLALVRKGISPNKSDMSSAVDSLPPEVREKVRSKIMEAMRALIIMMAFKSPITMVVCIPLTLSIVLIERCRLMATDLAAISAQLIQVEAEQSLSAIKIVPGGHAHAGR